MPLPKIDLPRYKHHLKGIDKTIKFRGFTTKEQKILLQAKEEDSKEQMMESVMQVIELCTFGELDVDSLPFFDIEDLFIRIRSKSVSEIVDLKYRVRDKEGNLTKDVIDVQINLNDVEVTFPEGHDKKIMITDDIGMVLKYPSLKMLDTEDNEVLLKNSIECIFDKDEVHRVEDVTEEELDEFIGDFDTRTWMQIKKFFKSSPRVRYEKEITLPDGEKKTLQFEGLGDFFI